MGNQKVESASLGTALIHSLIKEQKDSKNTVALMFTHEKLLEQLMYLTKLFKDKELKKDDVHTEDTYENIIKELVKNDILNGFNLKSHKVHRKYSLNEELISNLNKLEYAERIYNDKFKILNDILLKTGIYKKKYFEEDFKQPIERKQELIDYKERFSDTVTENSEFFEILDINTNILNIFSKSNVTKLELENLRSEILRGTDIIKNFDFS